MSKAEKQSEAALARVLVAWLKAAGWEVNEEVPFRADPASASVWIADVIATRWVEGRRIVAAYEVKKAMGLDVMEQADRWLSFVNQCWIVVPGDGTAASKGHAYGYRRLNDAGIGVLHVREWTKLEMQAAARPGGELPPIETRIAMVFSAEQNRIDTPALEDALLPEHRDGSFAGAGTKTGERATRTNILLQEIRIYLAEHDGHAPLDQVVRAFRTPWLIPRAKEGQIPRVRMNGSGPEVLLEIVAAGNETPLLSDRSSRTAPRNRVAFG